MSLWVQEDECDVNGKKENVNLDITKYQQSLVSKMKIAKMCMTSTGTQITLISNYNRFGTILT